MNPYTRAAACAAGTMAILALAACGSSGSSSPGSSSPGSSSTTGSSPSGSSPKSSPAASTAAAVSFPIAVGNTWTYKSTSVGLPGTVVNKMTAVAPVPGGQKVTMSDAATFDGSTNRSNLTYIFNSDGSISFPLSQLGNSVTVLSGGVVWPPAAAIASGQPYPTTLKIAITEDGEKFDVTAHLVVQGAGTQTISVPAGTYQATVIKMTMKMSVMSVPVNVLITNWVASGVGPVKDEVSETDMGATHVEATQELVSFTKG
jgi:hypothetical protein